MLDTSYENAKIRKIGSVIINDLPYLHVMMTCFIYAKQVMRSTFKYVMYQEMQNSNENSAYLGTHLSPFVWLMAVSIPSVDGRYSEATGQLV